MSANVHSFVPVSHSPKLIPGTKAIEKVMLKVTIKTQIADADA
jgi:hypothetical protein